MKNKKYVCNICGKEASINPQDEIPECCGEEMVPLDKCTKAFDPEMDRGRDEDDACEDFSGKQFDK